MDQTEKVTLIIKTRVKPESDEKFLVIQEKISAALQNFPGFIAQNVERPNPPLRNDWIIKQDFISETAAKEWLQSPERQELLMQARPFLMGIDNLFLSKEGVRDAQTTTAAIATKISPNKEQKFLEWQERIAAVQSKFPGFLGYTLSRPREGMNDEWIAIVTFDSDEHLEAWLQSSDRQKFLEELKSLSGESRIEKMHAGFDFWFTQSTDARRTLWKENMLVLLTLYPVVVLLSYIQNPLVAHGVPFWLALFLSNAASTVILGCVTVPWLMKTFSWWLHPKKEAEKYNSLLGVGIVLLLYGVLLGINWMLSK